MTTQGSAVLADVVGISAAVSVVGVFQQYPFHELVGTIAGCMAIAYYVYQFGKWLKNYWDNDRGG